MKPYFFAAVFLILFASACTQKSEQKLPTDTMTADTNSFVPDTVRVVYPDAKKYWNQVAGRLAALKIPTQLTCDGLNDSVQFELNAEQRKVLFPNEIITQKDPVISALYNLVNNKDTLGIVYHIYYPVVFDELEDIRHQAVLVLYNEQGQIIEYKTLAVNDYGTGYSRIKSISEILFLYTAEMETIETDLTTYSIENRQFKEVNTMHFSSRGSQDEYEKNQALIEKMMK